MAVSALCAGGLRAAPPARSRPAHTFTRPPAARRRRASCLDRAPGARERTGLHGSAQPLGLLHAPCTHAPSLPGCGRGAARLHQRLHLVRKALRGAQDAQAAQRGHRTSSAQVRQGAARPPAPGVQALLEAPLGARLRRAQPQRAH